MMLRVLQILCFGVLCLLIFTSYQQQIDVKALQKEISSLEYDKRVIGYANDVLQAEWAYANGPEQLKRLLETPQGKTLGLEPRTPDHYIDLADVPMGVPYDFRLVNEQAIAREVLVVMPGVRWTKEPDDRMVMAFLNWPPLATQGYLP